MRQPSKIVKIYAILDIHECFRKKSNRATLHCVTLLMAADKPLNRKEFESHNTNFLLAPQIQYAATVSNTDKVQIGKCEENRSPACPVKELFCLLQKIWRLRRCWRVCLLSSAHAAHWHRAWK